MKQTITLLAFVALTLTSFGQRNIDWSMESVIEPAELLSNEQTGTRLPIKYECKNNGSDTLYAGDTVLYNIIILDILTSSVVVQAPTNATGGAVFFQLASRDVIPGDTLHVGRNDLNINTFVGESRDIRVGGVCALLNRGTGGTEDTVGSNNSVSRDIIWFNPYKNGVGIDDVNYNNNLAVYPNPANKEVSVKLLLTSHLDVKVELIDMNGKTVVTEDVKNTFNNTYTLNTQGLENGVYIVKVTNGDEVNTSKVTISH